METAGGAESSIQELLLMHNERNLIQKVRGLKIRQGLVKVYLRIKVLGTLRNLFGRNRLEAPDSTLGVSPHNCYFRPKRDSSGPKRTSEAERRQASRASTLLSEARSGQDAVPRNFWSVESGVSNLFPQNRFLKIPSTLILNIP